MLSQGLTKIGAYTYFCQIDFLKPGIQSIRKVSVMQTVIQNDASCCGD